jgi:hypothetical protein
MSDDMVVRQELDSEIGKILDRINSLHESTKKSLKNPVHCQA